MAGLPTRDPTAEVRQLLHYRRVHADDERSARTQTALAGICDHFRWLYILTKAVGSQTDNRLFVQSGAN